MPPGMTILPVASITRCAWSSDMAPGWVTAAMVSPEIATSISPVLLGVITVPPRMTKSNMSTLQNLSGKSGKSNGLLSSRFFDFGFDFRQ
jgi:hypothetical protein